ncbi:hypothetical protein [Georgenia sp. SYP-B2076]|uniref:hypothetical protein n=1 Tax=Georgenia sp. SYP-B2076 TaxID=2495881 RepID=UPI001F0C921B|nr:hypothetical protein [Georgenia sp. SYP-B2076]
MALTPSPDLSAAAWIARSDQPWDELVTFGPRGFPAYARLRFLPDPTHPGQSENDVHPAEDAPPESEQLRGALDTLARHTDTPDRCYFCLWDGWGDLEGGEGARPVNPLTGAVSALARRLRRATGRRRALPAVYSDPAAGLRRGPPIAPAFPRSVLDGPKVVVPNRAFYLFQGRLTDFGDWGAAEMWPGRPRSLAEPAFVWPADHAWCVARDVDPHWAGIGADQSAIDELVADPRLDLVRADPRERPPTYY